MKKIITICDVCGKEMEGDGVGYMGEGRKTMSSELSEYDFVMCWDCEERINKLVKDGWLDRIKESMEEEE